MKTAKNKNKIYFFAPFFLLSIFFVGINNAKAVCDAEIAAEQACSSKVPRPDCTAAIDKATKCLENYNATKDAGCGQCRSSGDPLSCYKNCAGASGCSACDSSGDPLGCYKNCENGTSDPVKTNPTGSGSDLNWEQTQAKAPSSSDLNWEQTASKTATKTTSATGAKTSGTAAGATGNGSLVFTNPLQFNNVEGFLANILVVAQRIIVTLALVFIVIGALLYITAGANPDNAENGKKAITAALIGLAIGIGAPSLLKELGGIIGWNGVNSGAVAAAPSLTMIALKVLSFLLGILGIIAMIMLVIGGIMYLTSAGDEDRIEKGKETFKYSLLGIVIALSSMVLVTQIASFFAN